MKFKNQLSKLLLVSLVFACSGNNEPDNTSSNSSPGIDANRSNPDHSDKNRNDIPDLNEDRAPIQSDPDNIQGNDQTNKNNSDKSSEAKGGNTTTDFTNYTEEDFIKDVDNGEMDKLIEVLDKHPEKINLKKIVEVNGKQYILQVYLSKIFLASDSFSYENYQNVLKKLIEKKLMKLIL